ncbi:hypothetical protein [Streptomyces avermitilis]|uniref:Uncharacterized protein n=1 Tax=Streptomyces avermitilis TaxID=33903 RepID=A0A4D4MGZ7_STRAX|nr:hypothetical protein [Streptomyces avermitilis]GDY68670.1 hypothetical protein SAV14893_080630 [Streptomyces avermitilis]GDY70955.1 hypothetical protein SAV31267_004400 [Streptomyces avermitilis]
MTRPPDDSATHADAANAFTRPTRRFHQFAFWAPILAPIVLALSIPLPDGQVQALWPRLGCAVTVSLHLLAEHRTAQRRILPVRHRARRSLNLRFLLAALVVVSPLGGLLGDAWAALPDATAVALPIVLAVLGAKISMREISWMLNSRRPLRWIVFFALRLPAKPLCSNGILVFLVAGFRRPETHLVLAAWAVGVISLLWWAHQVVIEHDLRGAVGDVLALGKVPDDVAREAVVHWAEQSATAPSGETDTALVIVLCSLGQAKVVGGPPFGVSPFLRDGRSDGDGADRLIALAQIALETIDETRRTSDGRAVADRPVLFARAMLQQALALRAQQLNRPEDAAAHYLASAREHEAARIPNMAGICRIWSYGALAVAFFAPRDALDGLAAVADDDRLLPLVRKLAATTGQLALDLREAREANDVDVAGLRSLLSGVDRGDHAADIRALRAEVPAGASRMAVVSVPKLFTQWLQMLEDLLAGETASPTLYQVDLLMKQAKRAFKNGHEEEARRLAQEVKDIARRTADLGVYRSACVLLMDLRLLHQQWSGLYREMWDLVKVAESARQQMIDPQRKSEATVIEQQWYANMVALLLEGWHSADWPPPDAEAQALELVERSRARALLDVLGETLTIPVASALEPLAREEQEALAELRELRTRLVSLGGAAASDAETLAAVRRAEERLRAIRNEIEATGPAGAEYIELRRGTPIDYGEIRALLREMGSGAGQSAPVSK